MASENPTVTDSSIREFLLPDGITDTEESLHDKQITLSITSFYEGKHSDLTIKCGTSEFKVHKIILASRSNFFRACLESGFKEGQEGIIDMSQDNPVTLECLLEFLYTVSVKPFEYRIYKRQLGHRSGIHILQLIVPLFVLCDEHDTPELAERIMKVYQSDKLDKIPIPWMLHTIQPLNQLRGTKRTDELRRILLAKIAPPMYSNIWTRLADRENEPTRPHKVVAEIDTQLGSNPQMARELLDIGARRIVQLEKELKQFKKT